MLYARIGTGLITPKLNRFTWLSMRRIAPRDPRRRDSFLSFAGPLLLVLTVTIWTLLLFAGGALIHWPALGSGVEASSGPTKQDFATAFYYAGYSLTTLGTGDLVPTIGGYKVLMVVQALLGFSVLTLTLTYFMSVYSALLRRNSLAQSLHQMTAGTGSAADLLVSLGPEGDFREGSSQVGNLGFKMIDLTESHHLYPVLHYFRMTRPRYAFARVAYIALDLTSLVKAGLGEQHSDFTRSLSVQMLHGATLDMLQEVAANFLPERFRRTDEGADEEEARRQFRTALRRLRGAGIQTSSDPAAAEDRYLAMRREWAPLVRAFADFDGYRWEEISPGAGEPVTR